MFPRSDNSWFKMEMWPTFSYRLTQAFLMAGRFISYKHARYYQLWSNEAVINKQILYHRFTVSFILCPRWNLFGHVKTDVSNIRPAKDSNPAHWKALCEGKTLFLQCVHSKKKSTKEIYIFCELTENFSLVLSYQDPFCNRTHLFLTV